MNIYLFIFIIFIIFYEDIHIYICNVKNKNIHTRLFKMIWEDIEVCIYIYTCISLTMPILREYEDELNSDV